MNIMRVSPKEYSLEFSLNDSNIKATTNYANGEELDKTGIVENQKFYIEWEIESLEYSDFFTTLSFCAENGFFEKGHIEEVKNILENDRILANKKFLREKLMNKEYSGGTLDTLGDIYMEDESKKEGVYLFRSQVISDDTGRDIVFGVALDEKNRITFSVFFYTTKDIFSDEYGRFPIKSELIILWLDICRIFLCASEKTHKAIMAKLKEIKPIVDEIETQKEHIKESFTLNLNECHIGKDIGIENAYTIMPISNAEETNKTISITVGNYGIFNQHNLTFEHCVFNNSISIRMTFNNKMYFKNCTFKQIVILQESEFREQVSFECTTFESLAYFKAAHFHKNAYFAGSIFKNITLFEETIFEDNAYFDNTKFENDVSFQAGDFYKMRIFMALHSKNSLFLFKLFLMVILTSQIRI